MDYLYITENQYQDLLTKWEEGNASGIEDDPLAYIMVTDKGFIAIDNSDNEFFTEEFGTEIEAKLYLGVSDNYSKNHLIEAVKRKVTKEYQDYEENLINTLSKKELVNSASEIVTKSEVRYLLINDDYLYSLDSDILANMLGYNSKPLDEVWSKSLKFSEFDLSMEIIDHMLVSLYEEKSSLNNRLDFYMSDRNDSSKDTKESEIERWTN